MKVRPGDPLGSIESCDKDVVIIGCGAAGLSCAASLSDQLEIAILTKTDRLQSGSSPLAQGGVAASSRETDSSAVHVQDTLRVGAGLSDQQVAEVLAAGAPRAIEWLVEVGLDFDRSAAGDLQVAREGGHSMPRVVHAGGDRTGFELVSALLRHVVAADHVSCHTECQALELVVEQGAVQGVLAFDRQTRRRIFFRCPRVVLATGGYGRLFQWTTNAPESTGDGIALAARAGALLADLEFVQFHPTALAVGGDPLPLLTEALRGEGAVLRDQHGDRFMPEVHDDAELAPRDIVARAIWQLEQSNRGVAYLDATEAIGEGFRARFPTAFTAASAAGLDPCSQWLPVTPAAHYSIGGVACDIDGRSSVSGLWVVGEVAANGVHGGNRLASNSLAEALVFGRRLVDSICSSAFRGRLWQTTRRPMSWNLAPARRTDLELQSKIRRLMWQSVGLVRSKASLDQAAVQLGRVRSEARRAPIEIRNLWTLGCLVVAAAAARTKSCGCHFRADGEVDPHPRRRFWSSVHQPGRIPELREAPHSTRRAIA